MNLYRNTRQEELAIYTRAYETTVMAVLIIFPLILRTASLTD